MATTMKQFRLPDETNNQLTALSETTGKNQVDIVKEAIKQLHDGELTPAKRLDLIYQAVSSQIQQLVLLSRSRPLAEDEQCVYDYLYEVFHSIRKQPDFWEPTK